MHCLGEGVRCVADMKMTVTVYPNSEQLNKVISLGDSNESLFSNCEVPPVHTT